MNAGAQSRKPVLACGVGLLLAVGGCAAEDASPTPSGEFAQLVDTYLADPAASRYSGEQLHILETARAAGELEFEDYSAAVDASLECMEEAGVDAGKDPLDTTRGFPFITYHYDGTEAGNPLADDCIAVNSFGVEAIYQLQPTSVEASNATLEKAAFEFAACLGGAGIDADFTGLEGSELRDAVHEAVNEVLAASPNGDEPATECLLLLG